MRAITEGPSHPNNHWHQPAIEGIKDGKTPKSSSLCQCGNLHHNLISTNVAEQLLFKISLAIEN
jgi:hypothetical protein